MKLFNSTLFILFVFILSFCSYATQIDGKYKSVLQQLKPFKHDTSYINKLINIINNNRTESWDTSQLSINAIEILSEKLNYHVGLNWVYNYLANFYYMKGNYEKSITYAGLSLKSARILENKLLIGNALLCLAESSDKSGDFLTAKKYIQEAFSIFISTNDSKNIARCNLKLSFISYDLNQMDSCLKYAQESADRFLKDNEYEQYISATLMMGGAYIRLGKYKNARESVFKAKDICDRYHVKFDKSELLLGIAYAFFYEKNYDNAIKYGLMANRLAAKDSIVRHLWGSAEILSKSYFQTNDFKNAFLYLDSARTHQFKIFNKEKFNSVNELNAKYFTQQKEIENRTLKEKSEFDAIHLKQKNIIILLILVGIILLIGLLLVVIISRKKVLKSNRILNNKNRQIEIQNEQIINQNAILYKLNSEKDAQNIKLQNLNEAKDKFFSIVAHDLRNPFGTVKSFASLLNKKKEYNKDEHEKIVSYLIQSVDKTQEFLDNLLEWSRAQMNKITVKIEDLNVRNNILISYEIVKFQAQAKNIEIIASIDNNLYAKADRNLLHVVVRNLLTNAVKFSYQNSKIIVEAQKIDDEITISFIDFGIGIAPENLATLFKLDTKYSMRGTNNESGTGLGLLICNEFVELMNGTIGAESQLGIGSRFYIKVKA